MLSSLDCKQTLHSPPGIEPPGRRPAGRIASPAARLGSVRFGSARLTWPDRGSNSVMEDWEATSREPTSARTATHCGQPGARSSELRRLCSSFRFRIVASQCTWAKHARTPDTHYNTTGGRRNVICNLQIDCYRQSKTFVFTDFVLVTVLLSPIRHRGGQARAEKYFWHNSHFLIWEKN